MKSALSSCTFISKQVAVRRPSRTNQLILLAVLISITTHLARTQSTGLQNPSILNDEIEPRANFTKAAFRFWAPKQSQFQPIRGIVVLTPGANGDGRKKVDDPEWWDFVRTHHLALVACFLQGNDYYDATGGTGEALLEALTHFARQSFHPEVALAPLLLYGESAGGQFNYNFAVWKPSRVLAFVVNKGGFYIDQPPDSLAYATPGLFILGEEDEQFRIDAITAKWTAGRQKGALWSLAPQPNSGHEFSKTAALAQVFFHAVLETRLPAAPSDALAMQPMRESQGWLGDLTTHEIHAAAPANQAVLTTPLAAWLPDQPSALAWKAFVSATTAAEPAAKSIAYDVVSIHLNKSDSRTGSARSNPDGETWVNQPLTGQLGPAYGVEHDQVYGLPDWVATNRYDMRFKVAAEDIDAYSHLRHGQEQLMKQAVFEDRFKLKAHLGSKEVPMYNLVIAKGGLKVHPAKPGDTYPDGLKMPDGTPISMTMGLGRFVGQQVPVSSLISSIKGATGRQIIDKTGLTGKYDISIRWMPEQGPPPMLNGEPDTSLPSIFTVLEDQLGLKLEPTKGTVKTLIIDHIEPPTEN